MKLLLIDDQIDVVLSLKGALEPGGHECVTYASPREAVDRFRREHFDAVVTDYRMPDMDGIKVLNAVQNSRPGTPVVILTGYADTRNAIAALNDGAFGFFQKPIDLKVFFKTLADIEKHIRKDPGRELEVARLHDENESLLSEVHHRVYNNLQLVQSLLKLQMDKDPSGTARVELTALYHRIRCMALVQRLLHASGGARGFDLARAVPHLVKLLDQVVSFSEREIRVELDLSPVHVPPDSATAWGLVVNELVSNAVRHAFPAGFAGEKRVGLRLRRNAGNGIELVVSDNGAGLPQGFDFRTDSSLGAILVKSLVVAQLGGRIEVASAGGTRITVRVPLKSARTGPKGPWSGAAANPTQEESS